MEGQLLSKLYDMGILNTAAKLSDVENKVTVAAFCRRRLAVFMCMSKMAETVSAVCHSCPLQSDILSSLLTNSIRQ
jgi:U3 small nucleolar ribonucleoprotein protein IMP3